MRARELREHATCTVCKKPIGHTGLPLFWTLRLVRHGLNLPALQRQSGLEQFFNGHVALAQIMGADEDMTQEMMSVEVTLCENCAMEPQIMMHLAELADHE